MFTEEKDFFLPRGFFGLERGGERILGIEMPSRDDGRAGADYRESSKIVIHRSRSRVEREPTIISLITGFLEGERASSGGSTNPDETGPRANAEWNGIQPTRFSTSPATNCSFRVAVYPEIVLTSSAFDSCIPKRSKLPSFDLWKWNLGIRWKLMMLRAMFSSFLSAFYLKISFSSKGYRRVLYRSHSFYFIRNTVAIFRSKLKFQKSPITVQKKICL